MDSNLKTKKKMNSNNNNNEIIIKVQFDYYMF
jgi:hypothetical protein